MPLKWTSEVPTQEGIYIIRHKTVPQFIMGMNFKKAKNGSLMNVSGTTVIPRQPGEKDEYNPMPDGCLAYQDFLREGNCQNYEYCGPFEP